MLTGQNRGIRSCVKHWEACNRILDYLRNEFRFPSRRQDYATVFDANIEYIAGANAQLAAKRQGQYNSTFGGNPNLHGKPILNVQSAGFPRPLLEAWESAAIPYSLFPIPYSLFPVFQYR